MTTIEFVVYRRGDRVELSVRGNVDDGEVSMDHIFTEDGLPWAGELTSEEAEEAEESLLDRARDDVRDWERAAGEDAAAWKEEG